MSGVDENGAESRTAARHILESRGLDRGLCNSNDCSHESDRGSAEFRFAINPHSNAKESIRPAGSFHDPECSLVDTEVRATETKNLHIYPACIDYCVHGIRAVTLWIPKVLELKNNAASIFILFLTMCLHCCRRILYNRC